MFITIEVCPFIAKVSKFTLLGNPQQSNQLDSYYALAFENAYRNNHDITYIPLLLIYMSPIIITHLIYGYRMNHNEVIKGGYYIIFQGVFIMLGKKEVIISL